MTSFSPETRYLGRYTPTDGTIEFYQRIRSLCRPTDRILDLGAGRGAWFEDDPCEHRRNIRLLKGEVAEVIGADVDEAVLMNRSTDRNLVFSGHIDLPDQSVNVVIADYVLEHVENVQEFSDQIRRILVPGGLFCARTPHKYHYVSIFARVVKNSQHKKVLTKVQPGRRSEDVFPTAYRLNTLSDLENAFPEFEDYSYIFRADPSYYFGLRNMYKIQRCIHRIMPNVFSGNIFAFLKKP